MGTSARLSGRLGSAKNRGIENATLPADTAQGSACILFEDYWTIMEKLNSGRSGSVTRQKNGSAEEKSQRPRRVYYSIESIAH